MLHIRWFIFITIGLFPCLAIEHEEVAIQHSPDALKQQRVNSLTTENIIHVSAVARERPCKPRYAAPLSAQLSFNLLSNMNRHLNSFFPPQRFPAVVVPVAKESEKTINSNLAFIYSEKPYFGKLRLCFVRHELRSLSHLLCFNPLGISQEGIVHLSFLKVNIPQNSILPLLCLRSVYHILYSTFMFIKTAFSLMQKYTKDSWPTNFLCRKFFHIFNLIVPDWKNRSYRTLFNEKIVTLRVVIRS